MNQIETTAQVSLSADEQEYLDLDSEL